jgi:hypothetical protein
LSALFRPHATAYPIPFWLDARDRSEPYVVKFGPINNDRIARTNAVNRNVHMPKSTLALSGSLLLVMGMLGTAQAQTQTQTSGSFASSNPSQARPSRLGSGAPPNQGGSTAGFGSSSTAVLDNLLGAPRDYSASPDGSTTTDQQFDPLLGGPADNFDPSSSGSTSPLKNGGGVAGGGMAPNTDGYAPTPTERALVLDDTGLGTNQSPQLHVITSKKMGTARKADVSQAMHLHGLTQTPTDLTSIPDSVTPSITPSLIQPAAPHTSNGNNVAAQVYALPW